MSFFIDLSKDEAKGLVAPGAAMIDMTDLGGVAAVAPVAGAASVVIDMTLGGEGAESEVEVDEVAVVQKGNALPVTKRRRLEQQRREKLPNVQQLVWLAANVISEEYEGVQVDVEGDAVVNADVLESDLVIASMHPLDIADCDNRIVTLQRSRSAQCLYLAVGGAAQYFLFHDAKFGKMIDEHLRWNLLRLHLLVSSGPREVRVLASIPVAQKVGHSAFVDPRLIEFLLVNSEDTLRPEWLDLRLQGEPSAAAAVAALSGASFLEQMGSKSGGAPSSSSSSSSSKGSGKVAGTGTGTGTGTGGTKVAGAKRRRGKGRAAADMGDDDDEDEEDEDEEDREGNAQEGSILSELASNSSGPAGSNTNLSDRFLAVEGLQQALEQLGLITELRGYQLEGVSFLQHTLADRTFASTEFAMQVGCSDGWVPLKTLTFRKATSRSSLSELLAPTPAPAPVPGVVLWYNMSLSTVSRFAAPGVPPPLLLPQSALLCDEMGLGKSVQILALIRWRMALRAGGADSGAGVGTGTGAGAGAGTGAGAGAEMDVAKSQTEGKTKAKSKAKVKDKDKDKDNVKGSPGGMDVDPAFDDRDRDTDNLDRPSRPCLCSKLGCEVNDEKALGKGGFRKAGVDITDVVVCRLCKRGLHRSCCGPMRPQQQRAHQAALGVEFGFSGGGTARPPFLCLSCSCQLGRRCREQQVDGSGCSLLVLPDTLVLQWQAEVAKHFRAGSFKV